MSSNTSGVLAAVKAAVAGVSGLTDRVSVGMPPAGKPAAVPWGYVWLESVRSAQDTELGGYRRLADFNARLYVGATTDTPEARTVAAMDLMDLVVAALEADRTLGSTVLDVVVEATAVNGDTFGIGGVGVVEATVNVYWIVPSGVGL